MNITFVQPYINLQGWSLSIYMENEASWNSRQLDTTSTAVLPSDQIARNIWDPVNKRVVAWSSTSSARSATDTMTAWIIPSPRQAGDIAAVNVLVNNQSANNYSISNNLSGTNDSLIRTNQVSSLSLKLGLNRFTRLLAGADSSSTDSNRGQTTNQFQILPLPDQIVTIDSRGRVTVKSQIKSMLSLSTITVHNCYDTNMFLQQRSCSGVAGQNLARLDPQQELTLSVYRGYQIYLISPDSTLSSAQLSIQNGNQKVFFKTDGQVSLVSCTGPSFIPGGIRSFPPINGSRTAPSANSGSSFWSDWWWVILLIVAIVIIILIIIFQIGTKEQPTVLVRSGT